MTEAAQRPSFTGPNLTGQLQLSFQEKLVRRDLQVIRTEDITPRYRRIVLTGEDLAEGYPFVRFAPSDHVKAYFPDPKTGRIIAYREVGHDQWEVDAPGGSPIRRDYTPRSWDPDTGELALDFVLHEHGVAGSWAMRAQPGDALTIMGPRANWLLPENYRHYLAAGDETALPAISRLIEEAPAGSHITAVIAVEDAEEEQPLQPAPGVGLDLHWVHRAADPAGPGHGSALETALRAVKLPSDRTDLFAFAAGEARSMKPIRRFLRRELGLEKKQVSVDGYWKRGVADHDHHNPELAEED
ncbi:siderophore-interacting protein [Nesterenkonia populi]